MSVEQQTEYHQQTQAQSAHADFYNQPLEVLHGFHDYINEFKDNEVS